MQVRYQAALHAEKIIIALTGTDQSSNPRISDNS